MLYGFPEPTGDQVFVIKQRRRGHHRRCRHPLFAQDPHRVGDCPLRGPVAEDLIDQIGLRTPARQRHQRRITPKFRSTDDRRQARPRVAIDQR